MISVLVHAAQSSSWWKVGFYHPLRFIRYRTTKDQPKHGRNKLHSLRNGYWVIYEHNKIEKERHDARPTSILERHAKYETIIRKKGGTRLATARCGVR